MNELNERQKLFCKYYVSEDFYGSGVKAYCMAYNLDYTDIKDYNNAKVRASELLTKSNIQAFIYEHLDEAGLNDNFVDKQLLFTITQSADMSSKIKGIAEYNKLRQRIIDKSKVETSGEIIVKYGDGVNPA
jgi:phage terminase small subunit